MIRKLSLVGGLLSVFCLLGISTWALYHAPRLPLQLAWDGQAWRVSQGPPPFRPGQRLLKIGSHPVNRFTLLADNSELKSREELLLWLKERQILFENLQSPQVELSLQDQTLSLPVNRDNWDFLENPGLLHLPVGIAFFVVGWASYLRPGANRQAFWFYLMCLSMSLVYISNVSSLLACWGLQPPFWTFLNLLNITNFVLAPCLLLHFSLLIPRERAPRWLLVLSYSICAAVTLSLAIEAHGLVVTSFFLGSLVAIAQATYSYRAAVERQQMKWIGAGFGLGISPWLLFNGFPLMLTGHRLLSDTVPGAFLIFIPLGMAVAVHRYRLFDIGTFLEGTLAYLITLGLLLFCEWAVLGALGPQGFLLAVLASSYGVVRLKLAGILANLFRRRPIAPGPALEKLRERAAGRPAQEIPQALKQSVDELLAPSWLKPESNTSLVGARLDLEGEATVLLGLGNQQGLRCGPLPAGRVYDSATVGVLDQLARQASLYLENALLFEEAHRQQTQRLQERERLLGDLHDGVGAALAGIRMLSQQEEVTSLAGDALHELQSFLYDSPDYQMERLRFLAELRSYANRVTEGHNFELKSTGDLTGTLPRAAALSLFRLLREGLNNALKHSQAEQIRLSLHFAEQLRVVLEDNGQGFSRPPRGRGLGGIEKRVADLGGTLTWQTQAGVRLEVILPL
ncbi:hypothetical protein JST97_12860 [bacterium]|nr:hypothetical protein [bacterium]